MTARVSLRGYAVPFSTAVLVGGAYEFATPQSFADAVAKRARPDLVFRDHDGDCIGRVDDLFIDDFGLGFVASVEAATWRNIRYSICNGDQRRALSYVSVEMSAMQTKRFRQDGRTFSRIESAAIDHLCLCGPEAVYGRDTGVWPAAGVGDMPSRLARLAEHWEQGYGAHVEARRRARAKAAAARKRPAADAAKLPPSRLAAYADIRRRVAARIAAGAPGDRLIGCAAFSRAAGFDGATFEREILAAAGRQIGGLRR